jgi:hypothetical protein
VRTTTGMPVADYSSDYLNPASGMCSTLSKTGRWPHAWSPTASRS